MRLGSGEVVITGANSGVAPALMTLLADTDRDVTPVSRQPRPGEMSWERLRDEGASSATLVHAAPLPALSELLQEPAAAGFRRIIAFSTTRVLSDPASLSDAERRFLAQFTHAEETLAAWSERTGRPVVILRPTIIYGPGVARGINQMATIIQRLRFFPLVDGGRGLRQPVAAADLASAVVSLLDASNWPRREYVLPGGETLAYRDIIARLFHAMGRTPRMPSLPAGLVRAGIRVARVWPSLRHLDPILATRMCEDRVYDASDAARDLGYRPGPFRAERAITGMVPGV